MATKARAAGADQVLVSAIIEVESSWCPGLVRYEPGFDWVCDARAYAPRLGITVQTEACLQRFSYGLGQVMGGTARSLGFTGSLLTLLEPDINLEWMFRYIDKICGRYTTMTDKIAAYNAGTVRLTPMGRYMNQAYVDKVSAVIQGLL